MAEYTFKMPDIGEGVVEGEVVAWHVQAGDYVHEDQPLVDLMTDKATVTIPSTVHGKVIRTSGKPGDLVAVGRELIVFDLEGEMADVHGPSTSSTAIHSVHTPAAITPPTPPTASRAASAPGVHADGKATQPTVTPTRKPGERPLASPAVRRLAKEKGVDLAVVAGTGPAGRIKREDLESALAAGAAPGVAAPRARRTGIREVPMIGLRRKIAEKMAASKRHIPHFSYFEEVDVTHLEDLREHLNVKYAGQRPKLTYLPFVLQALVRALHDFPSCNAHFADEKSTVIEFEAAHLGIATQTDRGLMVPVIHHAEALDLWECATQMRRVIEAARNHTAKLEDLTGSTFTVTSLGPLGGLGATPIINHPEVGILGLHRAEDRPACRRGKIVVRRMMNLSSSFDHRVIDGATAAGMIQSLKQYLEHPATMFL